MTPQEKAKQLFDLFFETTPNDNYINIVNSWHRVQKFSSWAQAKECSLIAVDQIVKELNENAKDWDQKYWEEVRKEIFELQ
jgi:hypothetical protein